MPDQFKEVATTGYGSRILNSFKNVFGGLVLFIAAIVLLYWNEGRQDYSVIARQAVSVNADVAITDTGLNGKLVAATGLTSSSQMLGDKFVPYASTSEYVVLKDGKYLSLKRKVEMFAWKEDKTTNSKSNTGGSQTTETTYTYRKDWTNEPKSAVNFKYPEGHENPPMTIAAAESTVSDGKVGTLSLNMDSLQLPQDKTVDLSSATITVPSTTKGAALGSSQYVFVGKGTLNSPELGDLRVSYVAVPTNLKVTVFGKLDGASVVNYADAKDRQLYRMTIGGKDEGVALMHKEYTQTTWILRLLGFLGIWIGLGLLFGPITTLMDFLPIFGSISRSLVGLVTFFVALALSIVIILVSMIIHNVVALLIAVAAVIALVIYVMKRARQKKAAAMA